MTQVVLLAALASASALVLYAYAGYPLLLAVRARFWPAPSVGRDPATPAVTVVMVARDEQATLPAKLQNLLSLDYPADALTVVVASDGSRDETNEIVRAAGGRVRLVALPASLGKAAALNAALSVCQTDLVVLCDARQRLAPDAVRRLVAVLADPKVGAVSGELHIQSAGGATEGVGLYWRYEKAVRKLESVVDSTVGVTGALYAMRRALFVPLDPRIILDDVCIPMRVVLAGHRVVFEPLACAYDVAVDSPRREYRRKVRTLAGNFQLVALEPGLLDPRHNRLWWQLVSHKLARLAVPWALLVVFAATAALSAHAAWARFLLGGQVLFYALAGLGSFLERRHVKVGLLSAPHAFVLLNLAAAAALLAFVRGSESSSWKQPAS